MSIAIPVLLFPPTFLLLLALIYRFFIRAIHHSLSTLRNSHIWVIGASRGLGHSIALLSAQHGARVSISSRSQTALTPLANKLSASLAASVPLDITHDWSILRTALDKVEQVAPIDVLILNAGINHQGKHFLTLDKCDVDNVLATNLQGAVRMLHLALPRMLASRNKHTRTRAKVAVISSLAGYRGVPGGTIYGASKAALTALVQALRVELYDQPVDIVAIHPGFVDTDAIRGLDHPKPFMMDGDQAATKTLEAVVRGRGHFGFPWVMENIVLRIARLLPESLYEFVLFHTAG